MGQWHFHQDNAPVHNSILVTDYLTRLASTVPQHPYCPDLTPVTFAYSLVVMRQLRRWKRLWRKSLTCSHKRTSMEPPEVVGTVQQVHCSWRRLLRRWLEFHVCTINKSAHTKKSGNLFNELRIYIYIYIYTHTHKYIYIIYIYTHTHTTHTHIYVYIYIYI